MNTYPQSPISINYSLNVQSVFVIPVIAVVTLHRGLNTRACAAPTYNKASCWEGSSALPMASLRKFLTAESTQVSSDPATAVVKHLI